MSKSNNNKKPPQFNGGSEELIATTEAENGSLQVTEFKLTLQECTDAWAVARFTMERAAAGLDRKGLLRAINIVTELGVMEPRRKAQSAAERDYINAFMDMLDAKIKLFALQEAELQKQQN